MRRSALLGALVALAVFAPAFAKDEKVSIRGMPASVSPAGDELKKRGVLGTVLIESARKDRDTEYDKAVVKVTRATRIYKQVGRDLKEATFDDLKAGGRMEIQFQGPVQESFPVQATAGKIVILPR